MTERVHLSLNQVIAIGDRCYVVRQDPASPPRIVCGQIDRFIIEPAEAGVTPVVTLEAGQRVFVGVGVYEVALDADVAHLRYLYSASTD